MDLWIRSQNKKRLDKVDSIEVYANSIFAKINDENKEIGRYKTDKRALEVLEDIQNKISGKFIIKSKMSLNEESENRLKERYGADYIFPPYLEEVQNLGIMVYQMPEK